MGPVHTDVVAVGFERHLGDLREVGGGNGLQSMTRHFGNELAAGILHPDDHPEDHVGIAALGCSVIAGKKVDARGSPVRLGSFSLESRNRRDDLVASNLEAVTAQTRRVAGGIPALAARFIGA